MDIIPVTLSGQTVQLKPLHMDDTESLFIAANFPEIWMFTLIKINTLQDMRAYTARAVEQQLALPFVITDRLTGEVLGTTRLYDMSIQNRSLEIGHTWITPKVWRTKVNTECKYLLLKHSFEELGVIRVQFKTDSRNIISQNAITRIGGKQEGILRNHMVLNNGYVRDSIYYSIIDSEWPSIKVRLEQYLEQE
ncbi:GNAT family N-acetyltransferase [Paenibacillus pini]|uniref:GNAT family acetyltransferase BA3108 n=1 Tax=Paenibacillus pini JCM 16418 TaxID=1236976 RepID=W7YIM0_9BACL|nr:GNAT family protein [Paenibacillus pini]GAF10745.1 GNAT family acetyltransferase BA3108 [Paenibacillus pini JCM 16418]